MGIPWRLLEFLAIIFLRPLLFVGFSFAYCVYCPLKTVVYWFVSMDNKSYRQRAAKKESYIKYHYSDLEALPISRRYSISPGPIKKEQLSRPSNTLLSLPTEIRLLVWKYVITGHRIALYRKKGRLTHTLLDSLNTKNPDVLTPINPNDTPGENIRHSHGISRQKWNFPP